MTSRIIVAAALTGLVLGAGASAHAAGATVCVSSVTAYFNPPLIGSGNRHLEIKLTGSLTNCAGASPATASVSAGNIWTDPSTGFKWQEPTGVLDGSCISSTSTATTINRWNDGSVSLTSYKADSVSYTARETGANVVSVVLTAVNKQPGQADTFTLNATRDVGANMVGVTPNIDPNDPGAAVDAATACSGTGLESATLNGFEAFAD